MTKIAHLTSVHRSGDARIFKKECRTLASAGYDVTFVVPHDHDETIDGVRVQAVPPPSNRKDRILKTVYQVYRAALDVDASLYHFHDPELIPVGVLLRAAGKAVVYDVHEDVPKDILTKAYLPSSVRPALAWCAAGAAAVGGAAFDGIATATPAIARRFPPEKTVVLQNFALMDEWEQSQPVPYSQREARIAYIGGISAIRGIREILGGLALVSERLATRLSLAGSFWPKALEDEAKRSPAWRHVDFVGWRPRHELAKILGGARLGLVLFHPAPNHVEAQPNKLFEYMSAGLPVIASNFPLWRDLVEKHRCGLLVDPRDPQAIAEAIQWMLEHPSVAEAMGARGRAAVEKHYCWDAEAPKLLRLYDSILSRHASSH